MGLGSWSCSPRLRNLALAGVVASSLLLCVSCGGNSATPVVSQFTLQGQVHGGQQAVSGATIQLYAVTLGSGPTPPAATGYGGSATSLLSSSVTTNAFGRFTITGLWNCTTVGAGAQLYLVATGGNPGGGNNSALAMMTALGNCSSLTASTFIWVNELTTVASVYSLAQFMALNTGTPGGSMGTSTTNTNGLTGAFATVNNLVNTATGTVPGPSLPTGAIVPTSEMNTLADILAYCVNSSDVTPGTPSSNCETLFTDTGLPTNSNTIDAALQIALHPGNNTTALFGLSGGTGAPFQPQLGGAPDDWTLPVSYTGGGISSPVNLAIDGSGNIWVANIGNSSISEFSNTGAAITGSSSGYTAGGVVNPFGLAIDTTGTVWVANNTTDNQVTGLNSDGTALTGSPFTGGGLNKPNTAAVDASHNVWFTDLGNSSVSKFNSTGGVISTSAYTGGGVNQPVFIAIDTAGNAWIADSGADAITKLSGTDGSGISPSGGYTGGGVSHPLSLGIDRLGNVWVSNSDNSLSEFSSTGTAESPNVTGYEGGGISDPYDMAVDGDGNIWTVNQAAQLGANGNSLSKFDSSGNAISPATTGYDGGNVLLSPYGLSVDSSGNVWTANFSRNTLTEFVGIAAPLTTPRAAALAAGKLGQRP